MLITLFYLEAEGSSHVCGGPAVTVCLVQQHSRHCQDGGGMRGVTSTTTSWVVEEETQRVHMSRPDGSVQDCAAVLW